jgi:hypothetical protein
MMDNYLSRRSFLLMEKCDIMTTQSDTRNNIQLVMIIYGIKKLYMLIRRTGNWK